MWNPESWALESGIQLKESGIALAIGNQNPSSNDKAWNPLPESRIQDRLGFPCMGRVISNVSLAFSIQSQELDNL